MQKATPRGVLSADRLYLSPRQRQEYLRLKARGVPEDTAREMALAFEKSGDADTGLDADAYVELALCGLAKDGTHYERRFVEGAKQVLPGAAFDVVHTRARAQAGGHARARARAQGNQSAEEKLAALWEQRNALTGQVAELDQQIAGLPIDKSVGPAGPVHIDKPVGDEPKGKKKRKGKVVEKQMGVSDRFSDANLGSSPLFDAQPDALSANAARLVAGMDWEMRLGANGADDARSRASRALSSDMYRYDRIFCPDMELRGVGGVDLDLGCGQAREPGYLGLDLYPYDYGVALHDVSLGLPFDDSSARSIRLVNALEYMPDYSQDATPLLLEVQRVLNYGGRFIYEGVGDLEQLANFKQLPGLVLIEHEDTRPTAVATDPTDSQLHRQVFERVRVRVPLVYGANPEWLGYDEQSADDIRQAIADQGIDAPAEYAMADLFGKSEGLSPPEGVRSACRRGLDLAPEYGGQGLTDGAKARARSMAAGNNVSPDQLRRMRAFFSRHQNTPRSAKDKSPMYVSWLLWGGDAGKSWADSEISKLEKQATSQRSASNSAAYRHAVSSARLLIKGLTDSKVMSKSKNEVIRGFAG